MAACRLKASKLLILTQLKLMKKFLALLLIPSFLLISCSEDDTTAGPGNPNEPEPVNYTSGSADFSNYVALGNSLTAGYSDGALFIDGQNASYPNMLATNFALAGGGSFSIPLMADNLGGAKLGGTQILSNRLILSFVSGSPSPVPIEGNPQTEISNTLSGSFNNLGVPGAKSYHLLAPGYGNVAGVASGQANPYYARFASSADATLLGDALSQDPTFFSLWIGNNDILGYATSGGAGVNQTGNPDPSTYSSTDISDPAVFAGAYGTLLQSLTANGAGGVVANIPDVTAIPYFTTVPFAPLDPTNPDFAPQIPTLNATFGQLNQVFAALGVPERSIEFSSSSASAVVINDESLVDLSTQITGALMGGGMDAGTATVLGILYGQARQANETDLMVLPSRTIIAQLNEEAFAMLQGMGLPAADAGQLSVNGVTYPLEDKWVLTASEQTDVAVATAAYNESIASLAAQYDVAFLDANAFFQGVSESGVPLSDGSTVTTTYATGGAFSLDGVHPSPRGYALICNQLIAAINAKYGSNLPGVDPLDYKGLYIN